MNSLPRTLKLKHLSSITLLSLLPLCGAKSAGMQEIAGFSIDRTEVSVGQFRQFVNETGFVTKAEKTGGGLVYGAGWERKALPFSSPPVLEHSHCAAWARLNEYFLEGHSE